LLCRQPIENLRDGALVVRASLHHMMKDIR